MRTEQEIQNKLTEICETPEHLRSGWDRGRVIALKWVLEEEAEA